VGEWILDEKVGGGAFGTVWKARHHVWSDQLAAVKLPTDAQYVRALRREGSFAHKLDHPNVVRPLGFDPFARVPYLVMEFVPGHDLRRLIRQGPLEPARAVQILQQVLTGLSYAHGKGVVHRDIKPENVLLHEKALADAAGGFAIEGGVKVTDFGLGKADNVMAAAPSGGAASIIFSTDAHGDGGDSAVAGSLDYMAPEQRSGGPVDARADLYACGVMLFEMLTGERPAGTDVPSDLKPELNLPAHLDEVFRRSYARLEKRYASADEFVTALREAVPETGPMPRVIAEVGQVPLRHAAGACPSCGGKHEAGDQFCMSCGKQLVADVRRCGRCGAFPAPDDRYCMFCGSGLSPVDRDATDVRA
jgi:serine/threonine-protein kinase